MSTGTGCGRLAELASSRWYDSRALRRRTECGVPALLVDAVGVRAEYAVSRSVWATTAPPLRSFPLQNMLAQAREEPTREYP